MLREARHQPELFDTQKRPSGSSNHPPGVPGSQQNALSTSSKGRGAFFRRWRAYWSPVTWKLHKCPHPLSPLTTNSNMCGPHYLWESTAFCYDSLRSSACWGGGRRETWRADVWCGRISTVSLNEICCLVEFLLETHLVSSELPLLMEGPFYRHPSKMCSPDLSGLSYLLTALLLHCQKIFTVCLAL